MSFICPGKIGMLYILSCPGGGVTYKEMWGFLDWTLDLLDTHLLQHFITIYSIVVLLLHTVCSSLHIH
jgi:hypothetical protein